MTFHWINMLPVLLSTASVASPIKLTICFYSSMRSHSFAVTAVNKKEARFCSYIFLGFGTACFCWEIGSCCAAPEIAVLGITWFVQAGLVDQLTIVINSCGAISTTTNDLPNDAFSKLTWLPIDNCGLKKTQECESREGKSSWISLMNRICDLILFILDA